MARGRKTGGRQKGARNRATEEARTAAAETGVTPLDYMLLVMRDPTADLKRRDAMAIAAAPYLHPKLSSVDVSDKPPPPGAGGQDDVSINVRFVAPKANGVASEPCYRRPNFSLIISMSYVSRSNTKNTKTPTVSKSGGELDLPKITRTRKYPPANAASLPILRRTILTRSFMASMAFSFIKVGISDHHA
jgi:hypothetical protein